MKDRFVPGTLILIVVLSCGILFKADSQTQRLPYEFTTAVIVDCENQVHKSLIEDTLKRELRSIRDVKIVEYEREYASWNLAVSISLIKIPKDYAENVYAYSTEFYERVPASHFLPTFRNLYRRHTPVLIPVSFTGYSTFEKVADIARINATEFENRMVKPIRKNTAENR